EGFSYGLDFDGSALTITALTLDGTLTGSIGAEFFAPHLDNDPAGGWYTVGIVMDLSPPITTVLPAGADQPIVQALFDVDPGAPTATVLPMEFRSDLGDPAVGAVFVAQGGTSFTPTLVDGSFEIIQGAVFLRGDMDGSGMIDIADPIGILGYLFNNGQASCLDAADANDSGAVDVADPIYALDFLFNNGAPLPPPFPDPGIDPTDDPLDCGSYP
ncbi:MAG: hypothetical protein ACE5GW_14165, partial [Planctomycetota bacterium]